MCDSKKIQLKHFTSFENWSVGFAHTTLLTKQFRLLNYVENKD